MPAREYWTCEGPVRGCCGIHHRTPEAAERCCEADQRAVRRAYPSTFPTRAYSDRAVVHVADGEHTAPEFEPWIDW